MRVTTGTRSQQEDAMKYALRLAMLATLISGPVHAYEIETGDLMICDTRARVTCPSLARSA